MLIDYDDDDDDDDIQSINQYCNKNKSYRDCD